MKSSILILIATMFTTSAAFAETKICANLDKTATAEISENYVSVLLFRILRKVKIGEDLVFQGWRIDNSEPFRLNNQGEQDESVGSEVSVQMFSGGIEIQTYTTVYKMVCVAPELLLPENSEAFESAWNYVF